MSTKDMPELTFKEFHQLCKIIDYPSIFPDPYPMPKNPGDPKPYRIVAADHMIAYEGQNG